ncbi:hypothetical protein O0L34_g4359 [Tuta absoluta]|nr:hypothetical protein O0L34_g4359 [Tuta absoluta]
MLSLILCTAVIILVVSYLFTCAYERHENFPPGPARLPIYGALPILRALGGRDIPKYCTKLSQMYKTKVLGFYLASFPVVVVDDYKLTKEMLRREEFDGRLDIIVARLRSFWKRLGIFFTDGYFWYVQRRFSLRNMRDYGFGRRDATLEEVIALEIKQTIDIVANGPQYTAEKDIVKGDLVYFHYLVAPAFINGLLHVISRTTVPRAEYHKLWDLARYALIFQRNSDDFGGFLSLTPSLKDIAPKMSGYADLVKGNQYLVDFCMKLVNEALETHDESYDRHFLDIYISKMKEEQKINVKTTFSVEQLIMTCVDYLLPTASGGETLLTILLEHILMQPEVQDRVHEEIDRVVGRERLPTLDDRHNMPYTEACIRESMRMDPLVPMGVPHRSTKATTFAGYDLPENCALAVNYVGLGFDKELWGDPEVFRPERFIENGRISPAKDKSLPFGAGRRLCAGETFSRQIMFQVFAGLMQVFSFSPAGGQYTKPAARMPGIVITMPELWIRATPR